VVDEVGDHLLAVDASLNFVATGVVFQNVFVSFFNRRKKSSTPLVEVAFDCIIFVNCSNMIPHIFSLSFTVNTHSFTIVMAMNSDDVLLFFLFSLKKDSTPIVVLTLDDLSVMISFYMCFL